MNANTPSSSIPESSRAPQHSSSTDKRDSRANYERLLAEAGSLRGVSLWQDAQRRLKRNRAAIVSLYFLITIALAAFLTPALPLQSPIKQDLKNRKFQPPSLQSVSLGIVAHRQELQKLAEKKQAATGDEQESLDKELKKRSQQDPITTLWYKPNWLTVAMVKLRVALFGDYCVPSICGTDSLGRDVLARIFWGARVSLLVGVIATLVSLMIGVTYGATAGYLGGW
ncbi:MAG: ABC transporter permease, partial [Planctomycetota bacterium]